MRALRAGGALIGLLAATSPLAPQGTPCSADAIPSLEASARTECYLELGRLQEAAWMFAARGDRARAGALIAELQAQLEGPPESVRSLSADGVDNILSTYLVRFPSGVAGVFKPGYADPGCLACTEHHERAAYLLDTLMHVDLTPLTLVREVELPDGDVVGGSLMYFVADAEQSAVHYSTDGTPVATEGHKPDLLRLLDVFLGNGDRHQGNWLVRNTGEVAAIDHNRTFLHDDSARTTYWRRQYCRISDLGALEPWMRRFARIPVEAYGPEFATLLAPERLAAFRAARTEIIRTLRAGEPCAGA